ncbi:kinase-like domain-containing protein [Mucor mucedo]|uniref:kinase-like domain-containing protein n=1 Tax=Mucor mucedo TaxID=29922 RepID=UPI002220BFF6|nr:kinase-like domain-containing protein [Mucor mucedo]KAI7889016.1 kinase-like domain-containing protein [Mucor mucedo]
MEQNKRSNGDIKVQESRNYLKRKHKGSPSSVSSSISNLTDVTSKAYTPSKITNERKSVDRPTITSYELQEKLGQGSYGEVFKARNKESNDLVALKRMSIGDEGKGIHLSTIREINILKQLNHKNIIPLRDVVVDPENRNIYIVLPYMEHDLAGLLHNPNVKLTAQDIKTYLKQLLEATAHMHESGILHRDIKASNILINNDGILQIADFGLARDMDNGNEEYTKSVVTRWYRPPELILGEGRYTSAIDMWGVGCVFGELIKSRAILQGQDDLDQLKKIFNLCGSPNQKNMPNWHKLPDARKTRFKKTVRRVRRDYSSFDPLAADLLDKLLVLDPKKRLTALEALDHNYFSSSPLPTDPANLPKYEASHNYDRHRNKKPRHD